MMQWRRLETLQDPNLQNYKTYPKRDHTLRGRIENIKIPKEDKMSIKVKNSSQIKKLIIRKNNIHK